MDIIDIKRIVSEGYDKSKDLSSKGKDIAVKKIKDKIREKAYKNALERCKQEKVNPKQLSADEMGVIVNEEEKIIKAKIKDMSFTAILAFFGLDALV
jgi:hypothetical protein